MPKSMLRGFVILTVVVLSGGCGKKEKAEDKLIKEQIAILDSMTAEYGKVTDKSSMTQHQPGIATLWEKFGKVSGEFHALPVENKEAAMKTHAAQLEQALAGMNA